MSRLKRWRNSPISWSWFNTFNGVSLNSPFLGGKRRGIGVERGIEGSHDHIHVKHVRIDVSRKPLPVFGHTPAPG